MRLIAAVVWSTLLVTRPALGMQVPRPRLEPGARIRFDAPGFGGRVIGTLEEWESDTLVVRVNGDAPGLVLVVPVDSVSRLEVRRERSMTIEGALLGVLAGTLLAAVASPDVVDENGNCTTAECLAYKVSPHFNTRLTVLGIAGALLGTIVGSETRNVTWATVPLERLSVDATPNGGLALGVRIAF